MYVRLTFLASSAEALLAYFAYPKFFPLSMKISIKFPNRPNVSFKAYNGGGLGWHTTNNLDGSQENLHKNLDNCRKLRSIQRFLNSHKFIHASEPF